MKIHPIFAQNLKPIKTDKFCFVKNTAFISTPLKSDSFEKTETQAKPQAASFKGFVCSTENFAPRNLYDMPCACCGKKTLLDSQIKSFASDVKNKTGAELIAALERKRVYYCEVEGKVVDVIIKSAEENPEANLSELIKSSKQIYKNDLEIMQNAILRQLAVKTYELNERSSTRIRSLIAESHEIINQSTDDFYFKRKTFLKQLRSFEGQVTNKKVFNELLELAEILPTSSDSAAAFFIKYSRRGSEEIAERLLRPSMATTEHIIPQSNDKIETREKNNTKNYIVMCGDCNSRRSSMPYSQWLEIKPDMPKNFKIYIDEVIKRLKTGELNSLYADYPYDVCQTIKEQTGGKISVDAAKNICKEAKTKVPENHENAPDIEKRIEYAKKSYESRLQVLEELRRKKTEFENDPQYQMVLKYFELSARIEGLTNDKKKISIRISEAKKAEETLQKKRAKLSELEDILKNQNISPKERKKAEQDVAVQKIRISKLENNNQDVAALKAHYDEVSIKLKAAIHEKFLMLSTLSLPESIKEKEKEIEKTLEERSKIFSEIRLYSIISEKRTSLADEKEKLDAQLQQMRASLEFLSASVDFNSPKNKSLIEQYQILTKKFDIAAKIDPKVLNRVISTQDGIAPDFLLDEVISSLGNKLNVLKNKMVIRCAKLSAEIQALEDKIKSMEDEIARKDMALEKLNVLREELSRLESEKSTNDLKKELEELRNQRVLMQDRINGIDIENRIQNARSEMIEMRDDYLNLLNQKKAGNQS